MKKLPTIQLERLTLRPFHVDDAKVVQQLQGIHILRKPHYISRIRMRMGWQNNGSETHAHNFNEDRSLELAIVHKKNNM